MMPAEVTYRWVNGRDASDQDWGRVHDIIVARGWMPLNRATCCLLLVEDAMGNLLGFMPFQMIPFTGPLWLHPSVRGEGIADEMATRMEEFLTGADARGWLSICESPHAERICQQHHMTRVDEPVYIRVPSEVQ